MRASVIERFDPPHCPRSLQSSRATVRRHHLQPRRRRTTSARSPARGRPSPSPAARAPWIDDDQLAVEQAPPLAPSPRSRHRPARRALGAPIPGGGGRGPRARARVRRPARPPRRQAAGAPGSPAPRSRRLGPAHQDGLDPNPLLHTGNRARPGVRRRGAEETRLVGRRLNAHIRIAQATRSRRDGVVALPGQLTLTRATLWAAAAIRTEAIETWAGEGGELPQREHPTAARCRPGRGGPAPRPTRVRGTPLSPRPGRSAGPGRPERRRRAHRPLRVARPPPRPRRDAHNHLLSAE